MNCLSKRTVMLNCPFNWINNLLNSSRGLGRHINSVSYPLLDLLCFKVSLSLDKKSMDHAVHRARGGFDWSVRLPGRQVDRFRRRHQSQDKGDFLQWTTKNIYSFKHLQNFINIHTREVYPRSTSENMKALHQITKAAMVYYAAPRLM